IHILAAGDILLDRGVDKYLDEYGYDYPYKDIREEIRKADIAFGNLECPLTGKGEAVLKKRQDLIFRGNVQNSLALYSAGFDLLNLANNHSMDQGREGLLDTVKVLEAEGIRTLGAGTSRNEARKPVFIEKRGIRAGFLGYSDFPPEGYIYAEGKADVARPDLKTLGEEVRAAAGECDLLVVSFHWGKEFDHYPGKTQQELAHEAINNGADIIIGHHPHVLQSIEKYKGKLIIYSLGNFVFDRQLPQGTNETAVVDISFDRSGWKKVRVIPVSIVDCKPEIAEGQEAAAILDKYKTYSSGYGVNMKVVGGAGYIGR
ncbi:MAG TPA: CapA family protein, partial [Negativicutes bacterium]|nr:CapA family protein [Negativicutes bacterium]